MAVIISIIILLQNGDWICWPWRGRVPSLMTRWERGGWARLGQGAKAGRPWWEQLRPRGQGPLETETEETGFDEKHTTYFCDVSAARHKETTRVVIPYLIWLFLLETSFSKQGKCDSVTLFHWFHLFLVVCCTQTQRHYWTQGVCINIIVVCCHWFTRGVIPYFIVFFTRIKLVIK